MRAEELGSNDAARADVMSSDEMWSDVVQESGVAVVVACRLITTVGPCWATFLGDARMPSLSAVTSAVGAVWSHAVLPGMGGGPTSGISTPDLRHYVAAR